MISCCDDVPPKVPDSILSYGFDWNQWLAGGENITGTPVIIVPSDLTLNPNEGQTTGVVTNVVTFWLGGGSPGAVDTVTCQVTTTLGNVIEASFDLSIKYTSC